MRRVSRACATPRQDGSREHLDDDIFISNAISCVCAQDYFGQRGRRFPRHSPPPRLDDFARVYEANGSCPFYPRPLRTNLPLCLVVARPSHQLYPRFPYTNRSICRFTYCCKCLTADELIQTAPLALAVAGTRRAHVHVDLHSPGLHPTADLNSDPAIPTANGCRCIQQLSIYQHP